MVEMYRRKITNLEYDLSEYRDRLSRDSIKGRAMEGALNDLKQQLENTRLGYSTEITKLREMERSTQFELSLNKKVNLISFPLTNIWIRLWKSNVTKYPNSKTN